MIVTIDVTQEHVEQGLRDDCNHCPVALAIKERLIKGVTCSVGWYVYEFYDNGVRTLSMRMPAEARSFVISFDHKNVVRPFSFELDIPQDYLKV